MKNYLSEFAGTFGFVFIGCGATLFATPFIGYLGTALAFGAAYGAMNYAFHGHFNPAATLANAVSGRMNEKNVWFTVLKTIGYIALQIAGACAAVALIYHIYAGKTGYVYQGTPDANIVDRYTLSSAFLLETVLTFLFACVFLGSDKENRPLACALFITSAGLLSRPVTKEAVNAARSTASALFSGDNAATAQLPLFWGACVLGAVLAGLIYSPLFKRFK